MTYSKTAVSILAGAALILIFVVDRLGVPFLDAFTRSTLNQPSEVTIVEKTVIESPDPIERDVVKTINRLFYREYDQSDYIFSLVSISITRSNPILLVPVKVDGTMNHIRVCESQPFSLNSVSKCTDPIKIRTDSAEGALLSNGTPIKVIIKPDHVKMVAGFEIYIPYKN